MHMYIINQSLKDFSEEQIVNILLFGVLKILRTIEVVQLNFYMQLNALIVSFLKSKLKLTFF